MKTIYIKNDKFDTDLKCKAKIIPLDKMKYVVQDFCFMIMFLM